MQYNKAIVGRNAFAHESGIHQDGMLKNTADLRDHDAGDRSGVSKTSLVMGKHSGRNAFRAKLKELGYELGENALEDAFKRFKDLADRKKHVYDEDIEALVDEEIATAQDRIKVVALTRHRRHHGPAVGDPDARHGRAASSRPCRRPATARSMRPSTPSSELVPHKAKLALYQVHAVTEGTDAQAEVSVRLEDGRGRPRRDRRAADPDTLVASRQGLSERAQQAVRQARPAARAAERISSSSGGVRPSGSDTDYAPDHRVFRDAALRPE